MTPDEAYEVMIKEYEAKPYKYVRIRYWDGTYFKHNSSRFASEKGARFSFTHILTYNIPGYYESKDPNRHSKFYEQAKQLVDAMLKQELITFEEVEEYE